VVVPGAGNVTAALIASGLTLDPSVVATGSTGVNLFANGINTRTRGVDFVLNYPTEYPFGRFDWTLGATWNETTITSVIASPAALGGQPLFNATAYSDLTTASPKLIVNLGLTWTMGIWSVTAHEILYGPTSEWDNDDADNPSNKDIWYNESIGTLAITNLELGMQAMKNVKIAIGANNLFNRYPEQINPNLTAHYDAYDDNAGVTKYPSFSPFGIDGGFYYARASLRF